MNPVFHDLLMANNGFILMEITLLNKYFKVSRRSIVSLLISSSTS